MSLLKQGAVVVSLILVCIVIFLYSRQSPASELEMFMAQDIYNEDDRNLYGIPVAKEFIKKKHCIYIYSL